jgi:hypothetical protein
VGSLILAFFAMVQQAPQNERISFVHRMQTRHDTTSDWFSLLRAASLMATLIDFQSQKLVDIYADTTRLVGKAHDFWVFRNVIVQGGL